ncbi:hypothetical protein SM092_001511 [Cronobacter sakazakii]|nr:hypothetical protein [Cronobacter sakazakii]
MDEIKSQGYKLHFRGRPVFELTDDEISALSLMDENHYTNDRYSYCAILIAKEVTLKPGWHPADFKIGLMKMNIK